MPEQRETPAAATRRLPMPRLRIDGSTITNAIQNDKCFDCGMGLCDPREWHPYIACVAFKSTHDSTKVWDALYSGIAEGIAPWQN